MGAAEEEEEDEELVGAREVVQEGQAREERMSAALAKRHSLGAGG